MGRQRIASAQKHDILTREGSTSTYGHIQVWAPNLQDHFYLVKSGIFEFQEAMQRGPGQRLTFLMMDSSLAGSPATKTVIKMGMDM